MKWHNQHLKVITSVMSTRCQVFKALKRYSALLIRPAVAAALQEDLQALVQQIDHYLDNLQSEFEHRAQVHSLSASPACLPACFMLAILPACLPVNLIGCLPVTCLPLPACSPKCLTCD